MSAADWVQIAVLYALAAVLLGIAFLTPWTLWVRIPAGVLGALPFVVTGLVLGLASLNIRFTG